MKNVALITGASSGIGRELAKVHAKNGGDLILVARSEDALIKLKSELEVKFNVIVHVLVLDLTEKGSITTILKFIQEERIQLSVLMNNAGFGGFGFFVERNLTDEERMIDLNIKAVVGLTHAILPLMIKQKSGRILNTASTAGFIPGPMQAVYFATKAFVLSFTRALSNELKGTGVTITALCPGPVKTGFAKAANLEGSTLFESGENPAHTAKKGYNAMLKGKTEVISSFKYAFALRILLPFVPTSWVASIVRREQSK